MKTIKTVAVFFLLSISYLIFWNVGLAIGNLVFPSVIPQLNASPEYILFMMFLACGLNTFVVMFTISNSRWSGIKLFSVIALEIYVIQFFLSQIETLWFNEALELSMELIYSIFLGGLFAACLFSLVSVWIMGRFKTDKVNHLTFKNHSIKDLVWRIGILAIIIYPILYFLAGYFIAWQFEAVRLHYSGSSVLQTFWVTLWQNIKSNLWFWQIARGLLWIAIAWPVLKMTRGGFPRSGLILGLLFAVLMNAQHLIPNPYMPGIIPLAHAIETASSNFIWGFIIAWMITPKQVVR